MISRISVFTRNKEALEEITHRVSQAVTRSGVQDGMCYLFVPHTTAGVIINENADPSVARDIITQLEAMVPSKGHYQHLEGSRKNIGRGPPMVGSILPRGMARSPCTCFPRLSLTL